MSQVFDAEGNVIPVTLVRATPNAVLQVKSNERDGYRAIQVGFGARRTKNVRKPQLKHFKDLGVFRYVREFRVKDESVSLPDIGTTIEVTGFIPGDTVKVSGIAKSKGFQGVVKRYGFHGAPATHGTKHAHRQPGSISGAGGRAGGKVAKGMRMAGRTGGRRISIRNTTVVAIDQSEHLIAIKGALPGRAGTLLEIRG